MTAPELRRAPRGGAFSDVFTGRHTKAVHVAAKRYGCAGLTIAAGRNGPQIPETVANCAGVLPGEPYIRITQNVGRSSSEPRFRHLHLCASCAVELGAAVWE